MRGRKISNAKYGMPDWTVTKLESKGVGIYREENAGTEVCYFTKVRITEQKKTPM